MNTKPAPTLDPKLVERVLAEVREDEIISMSSDVINIPSPTGEDFTRSATQRRACSRRSRMAFVSAIRSIVMPARG